MKPPQPSSPRLQMQTTTYLCITLPHATPLQVWTAISQRSGDNTGALARLHSALISTVTHLISRLGVAAMQVRRGGAG